MRIAVLILVLANLAFFAWARWIDVPREPRPIRVESRVPRLELLSGSERAAPAAPAPPAEAPAGATPPAEPPPETGAPVEGTQPGEPT